MGSFVAVVVIPSLLALFYMFAVAKDQFTSTVGFSVRSEEISSALGLLSGLTALSRTSSSDISVLYEYLQSQELVRRLDDKLDLRGLYSKAGFDPVFALDPDGSIEELVAYWKRMVKISYDSGTGLIELRVHAFAPPDAKLIAQQVFDESSQMINELSSIARADATRYAKEELDKSVDRLKQARQAMTEFRSRTQIVDPTASIQGQMGLLNNLQQQLAESYISLHLLRETTREGDPRIADAERRITVVEGLIAGERQKFGGGADSSVEDYSTLVGEYERLAVDREFAEKTYLAALAASDEAQAEAQRQSRYLAAHVKPTLAEKSIYPQRLLLTTLVAAALLMAWAIAALIYYAVRDRR